MKLITYIEHYARLSLNYHEIKAFAIPNMKKGWKKRYAELEIPDSFVEELAATISPTKKVKRQQKKLKKKLDFAVAYEKTSDQLLYLMENSNGLLKIGISIEPVRRARNLTTASGVPVHLVAVWKLDKNTRKVEGQLHKSFSKYRLEGEWFSPGSVTPEKIEDKISCNWERMLLNKSLEERKLKAKPADTYQYSSIKVETPKAILFIIDGKEQWCPACGISYNSNYKSLSQGCRGCHCSNSRQKQLYLNIVYSDTTPVALKFGVANDSDIRLKVLNQKSNLRLENYAVWNFEYVPDCLKAETELKQTLETGVISREEMWHGWTETTYLSNIDYIISKLDRLAERRIEE